MVSNMSIFADKTKRFAEYKIDRHGDLMAGEDVTKTDELLYEFEGCVWFTSKLYEPFITFEGVECTYNPAIILIDGI
jgi:hypothetical protein